MGESADDGLGSCDFGIVTERAPIDIIVHKTKKGPFSETDIRYRMASKAFGSHGMITPVYIEKIKYHRIGHASSSKNTAKEFSELPKDMQVELVKEYNKILNDGPSFKKMAQYLETKIGETS